MGVRVSRDGRGEGGAVHDRRLVPPKDRAVGGRCLATLSVRLQVFAFKHFSPRKLHVFAFKHFSPIKVAIIQKRNQILERVFYAVETRGIYFG